MAAEKILVVDDSPTELQLMVEPLIDRGYQVITATNGIDALETAIKEHPRADPARCSDAGEKRLSGLQTAQDRSGHV